MRWGGVETAVAHPERHLAVFCQQGHVKDKTAQELLQHGGPEVSANEGRYTDKSMGAPRTPLPTTSSESKRLASRIHRGGTGPRV